MKHKISFIDGYNEGFAWVQFNDDSVGYLSKDFKFYEEDKKTLIKNNDPRRKTITIFNIDKKINKIMQL